MLTLKDLEYHAKVLDLMEMGDNSVMVIHGGVYGDKEETIKDESERYEKLPDKIKNRLVLENCAYYSIEDCLLLFVLKFLLFLIFIILNVINYYIQTKL